jgi:hypothetical protein
MQTIKEEQMADTDPVKVDIHVVIIVMMEITWE